MRISRKQWYRSSGSYIANISNWVVRCLRNRHAHSNEYDFYLEWYSSVLHFRQYFNGKNSWYRSWKLASDYLSLRKLCNLSVGTRETLSVGDACQERICCILYFTYLQFSMLEKKGSITKLIGRKIHQVMEGHISSLRTVSLWARGSVCHERTMASAFQK